MIAEAVPQNKGDAPAFTVKFVAVRGFARAFSAIVAFLPAH